MKFLHFENKIWQGNNLSRILSLNFELELVLLLDVKQFFQVKSILHQTKIDELIVFNNNNWVIMRICKFNLQSHERAETISNLIRIFLNGFNTRIFIYFYCTLMTRSLLLVFIEKFSFAEHTLGRFCLLPSPEHNKNQYRLYFTLQTFNWKMVHMVKANKSDVFECLFFIWCVAP